MRAVEAPFQLVVSVIGMILVLGLAYTVLANAVREDCTTRWEMQLRDISTVISTVIQGGAPTKLKADFDFRCGGAQTFTLYLREESDTRVCLKVCGHAGVSGRCGVLRLVAETSRGGQKEVVGDVSVCVEGMEGYVAWDRTSPCGVKNITGELLRGYKMGLDADPPFGTLIMEKTLESGEPVRICRVR